MILHDEYYDQLKEHIHNTPDFVFWMRMLSKKEILKNEALMKRMWTEYQKNIEQDVDTNYAYAFTLEEILNIPLRKWEKEFHLYIDSTYNDLYGR